MFFSLDTQTFKAHLVKTKCILKALKLRGTMLCELSFFRDVDTFLVYSCSEEHVSKIGSTYDITALVRGF